MVARARRISTLACTVLIIACGEAPDPGFSASNPGLTSVSQSGDTAGTTGTTGTTSHPTGDDSVTTNPACAELTLCPGTSDASDATGVATSTTAPATSTDSATTSMDTGESDDPCSGAGDGNYCGATLGGFADHNSVYQCLAGMTAGASPCPAGCENGACKQVQDDPCASAQSGNGSYCGGTLMGGDGNALYNCQNGGTAGKQVCDAGCKVNPPGIADACNPEGDPCQGANSGDGAYCGAGLPGGDPNVLYTCKAKMSAGAETCAEGCQQNEPGVADVCKKPQNGGECCLDVPPGVVTQNYSACGNGGSHYGIDYGTAIGTPIYAGIAGTVVGSALGFPNCYNNGCAPACWNAFNFVKLKADCGDPDNPANDLFVYYLHIDSLAGGVANGTHLDQGQMIAKSGNSGCSSGPHIHIETTSVPKGQNAVLNTCASVAPGSRYCP
ncbi:MAG: M23 family metallopeptidase [Nannocystis sp.]|nr:M23 family metallopeptidase [Nannocystis sp.]MBA3550054.1 M23 family metallopeptidase [Nannocystis sp.]